MLRILLLTVETEGSVTPAKPALRHQNHLDPPPKLIQEGLQFCMRATWEAPTKAIKDSPLDHVVKLLLLRLTCLVLLKRNVSVERKRQKTSASVCWLKMLRESGELNVKQRRKGKRLRKRRGGRKKPAG
jgi:hypothetical protein